MTVSSFSRNSRQPFQVLRPIEKTGSEPAVLYGCPGEDLNLHAFRLIHLKDKCLPISTPGRDAVSGSILLRDYTQYSLYFQSLS